MDWNKPFWEDSLSNGLLMQDRAVKAHMITSYYGVPLMVKRKKGLVIEVTDGIDYSFRGHVYYSLAKISAIHLAYAMAEELRPHQVTALAVTPGFLRSEEMLEHMGVREENWQDAISKEFHFSASETPYFLAQGIVALATDPHVSKHAGKVLPSWHLSDQYGFKDIDGRKPHWGQHAKKHQLLYADK